MTRPPLTLALALALACSSPQTGTNSNTDPSPTGPIDAGPPDAGVNEPAATRFLVPRGPTPRSGGRVAAKVFAFADTQLHYLFGKRTFAQSPFADRMAFEVAVRPAALDDGSDLLLSTFVSDYVNHYSDHALVFLGDAADVSCEFELTAFLRVLANRGIKKLYGVASNHDGFFVGNFTSKDDLDGNLALTDMPNDWTRACSVPGSRVDRRLTKGRAVRDFATVLPEGPLWATSSAHIGVHGPDEYKASWLYYVRRLPGGSPDTPPVWGIFLDTVDFRGFDLKAAKGAGSNGGVSRLQLRFLDRAMFEAAGQTPGQSPIFVLFGHHPMHTLEPASRKRLVRFIAEHRGIVGYVSAHEHTPARRAFAAGGRTIPEYVVGSTTDFPNSASIVEVRVDSRGPKLAVTDLYLDVDGLCGDVARLPPTSLGYTGYRISRDDTPDVDVGTLDKLAFAVGLSELEEERAKQVIGALLVENELVRSLAELYLLSPLSLPEKDRATLRRLVKRRYAAGSRRADLAPYLRGAAPRSTLTDYDKWDDPVIARVATSASQGVHRFGPNAGLFYKLRALRTLTAPGWTYFVCHAAYAAEAESKRRRQRGNVLYIR